MPNKEEGYKKIIHQEEKALFQFERNKLEIELTGIHISRLKKRRNQLDATGQLANIAQITSGIILFFYAKSESSNHGPEYLKISDLVTHFSKSWSGAIRALGQTFAFIGYASNGLRALWDLGVTGYRWSLQNTAKKIAHLNPYNEKITLIDKQKLITRTTANIIIATFNIIAVVTVLGLFTTGIGLALAAFAAGVGWVKDSVIPWVYVRKELAEAEQELRSINTTTQNETLAKQREITEVQIQRLKKENESYRNGMMLGALSVVAFALFATGPFGLATLSMIGSVALVACTCIGIGRMIYKAYKNRCATKSKTDLEHEAVRIDAESELDFRQKSKLTHWMSSTHQIMKAKMHQKIFTQETIQSSIADKKKHEPSEGESVTVSFADQNLKINMTRLTKLG